MPDQDRPPAFLQHGLMEVNPSRRLATGCHRCDAEAAEIESHDGRCAGPSLLREAEAANNHDAVAHQSGRVKIRGREDFGRISKNIDPPVRVKDNYIVVDVEIRVVVVLMLTSDQHSATTGQFGCALAKSIKAPSRTSTQSRRPAKSFICLIRTDAETGSAIPKPDYSSAPGWHGRAEVPAIPRIGPASPLDPNNGSSLGCSYGTPAPTRKLN